MSKLGEDGKPIYREDGKVLKGPNYEKPKLDDLFCTFPVNVLQIRSWSEYLLVLSKQIKFFITI